MKILALDVATKLGWAYFDGKAVSKYGTEDFHNKKWDGAGMRYLYFRNWLTNFIQSKDIEVVFIEKVEQHQGGVAAAHVYGGLLAVLQSVCEELDVPYSGSGVGQIKKFWTGNARASKDDMIAKCFDEGFNPKDDNAADAIAICHVAIGTFRRLL